MSTVRRPWRMAADWAAGLEEVREEWEMELEKVVRLVVGVQRILLFFGREEEEEREC